MNFNDPLPAHDLHLHLMDAAGALGADYPDSFGTAPYLHAMPEKVARWQSRLKPGRTIGIVSAGSPAQLNNDRNRSMPLAEMFEFEALKPRGMHGESMGKTQHGSISAV